MAQRGAAGTGAAALLALLAVTAPPPAGTPRDGRPLVLVDATIISFTGAAPLTGQSVVIRGGRIVLMGPTGTTTPPAGSQVISVRGKVVIPGLTDMHVHNIVRDRWRLLGYGITAVRGMWGVPSQAALRDSVDRGETLGPWITLASPGLDSRPASWPLTQLIDSLGDVEPTVRRLRQEGWTWLKVYNRLSLAAYDSIAATARGLGIRLVGHVPFAVPVEHALASHQLSIEHLSGYGAALNRFSDPPGADSSRMLDLVRATVRAGTWNCPTLTITGVLAARNQGGAAADRISGNRRRLVAALYRGGARLLIGTDSGIDIVPAGSALIEEINQFALSGIPLPLALRIATYDAAEFLGKSAERGTIAPGMIADLLVLDDDPTRDLQTLQTPAGLVLHGGWVPGDTLAAWRRR
jgi:Amidohydrolase family